mmetsp:Transcript_14046/g.41927  ORF Transcript_14046/g.41927 Transcript_14046/m.41927 type:complete len:233 (-) Transcript_14046:91-789(-)
MFLSHLQRHAADVDEDLQRVPRHDALVLGLLGEAVDLQLAAAGVGLAPGGRVGHDARLLRVPAPLVERGLEGVALLLRLHLGADAEEDLLHVEERVLDAAHAEVDADVIRRAHAAARLVALHRLLVPVVEQVVEIVVALPQARLLVRRQQRRRSARRRLHPQREHRRRGGGHALQHGPAVQARLGRGVHHQGAKPIHGHRGERDAEEPQRPRHVFLGAELRLRLRSGLGPRG